MSATLSAPTFTGFFSELRRAWGVHGEPPDADPRSTVHIEGRMFPVKECFLEDALEWTGVELPNACNATRNAFDRVEQRLSQACGGRCPYSESTLRSLAVVGEGNVHLGLIRELVMLFHSAALAQGDENRGGILIFLPGWADIASMHGSLCNEPGLWTLMLHSNISPEEQQRVFEEPNGRRKVVLSTNIAETSVTIDDIVFVINSGVMKERVFDADRHLGALETTMNTRTNATQRKGRAGRTQEGVVVHLFPRWKLDELREWPTPEILSKSLEEVVLNLLALGLGDPHEVLAKSMSSPSVACVEHAVWLLQEMNMMGDQRNASAHQALLPLGRWLAPIPLHPMSSKALLYGALFGVLLPVTAAVAFLNLKNPFVRTAPGQILKGGKEVLGRGVHSDHYAMAAAYLGWRARAAVGDGDAFVEEHGLSRETLDQGDQLVRSLLRLMVDDYEYDGDDATFADDASSGGWGPEAVFDDPRTWMLCKAALCAAFTPFLVRCTGGVLASDCNEEVSAHASSCNASYQPVVNPYAPESSNTDDWLLFSDAMKTGKVSIMESTTVGAPYALLFARRLAPVTSGARRGTFGRSAAFASASSAGTVDFDGWRGTLVGGEQALADLQSARGDLELKLSSAMEMQTAQMLNQDLLDRLVGTLGDRRLFLKDVVGTRQQRVGEREARTIFVGNVSDVADEDDIRRLFSQCGRVEEARLVCENESGRRRGFGFVAMSTRAEAQVAARRLNGAELHGKRVRLDLKGVTVGSKGKGKGKVASGPVVFAKPAERNTWISTPTDEERRAMAETLRAEALRRTARGKRESVDEAVAAAVTAAAAAAAAAVAAASKTKLPNTESAKVAEPVATPAASDNKVKVATVAAAAVEAAHAAASVAVVGGTSAVADASARTTITTADAMAGVGAASEGSSDAMGRWSELLLESAQVRVRKRRAAAEEDFAEASRLKRLEVDVTARVAKAEQTAASERGNDDEVKRLEESKRRAVEEEDFAEASRLKKRLQALREEAGGGSSAGISEEKRQSVFDQALVLASRLGTGDEALAIAEELRVMASTSSAAVAGSASNRCKQEAAGTVASSNGQAALVEGNRCKLEPGGGELKRLREGGGLSGSIAEDPAVSAAKRRKAQDAVAAFMNVKVEELSQPGDGVKEESGESPVPGFTIDEFVKMANQDVWQQAWNLTWRRHDAAGTAGEEATVYAEAQKLWKGLLQDRDRLGRERAAASGKRKAEELLEEAARAEEAMRAKGAAIAEPEKGETSCSSAAPANAPIGIPAAAAAAASTIDVAAAAATTAKMEADEVTRPPGLSEERFQAQQTTWRNDKAAQGDWDRLTSDVDKKRKADEAPKTGRDLCALVKQRCPADQPMQFERILAVCPKDTSVRQLIQAMAKEPQEFRQSWDASEFCIRPCNSRCVDWLPVQAMKIPPGFREDAVLPEEMLVAAKSIFQERLRPQGQFAEDPLAQFLTAAGRLPTDVPLTFDDILRRCPPGTAPADLIKTMSKRRDTFRQNPEGTRFCAKPRVKCRDWSAVNPYLNAAKL
eukprot:TRINITY_DN36594_c0_g1_i1.p1 TRINITY_DN36594_c0_g1~~TRINITY_DN36594_c0_g1_i1.p1  ORF type:complete len:1807 (-),score=407.54 TRINITY_DN36594_c0_g1_i1:19-4635(-)